jgi:hypothetical protein
MNQAIICETHDQAKEAAEARGWRVKAVYIVPADDLMDVRNELLLKRKLESVGMSGETAGRAVGTLLGWLRQRAGATKWLAYATP